MKSGFPFFSSGDSNVVEAGSEVELGVDRRGLEAVKEIGDKREWVPVLPGDCVELAIVDAKSKAAVFLLGE